MSEAGLLDTSIFIALEAARPIRLELLPERKLVSAITAGELRFGVLMAETPTAIHVRSTTLEVAVASGVLPVDEAVAERWGYLTAQIRKAGRRAGINDLWIAATAAAHDLPVYTQDSGFEAFREFGGPEVRLI